MTKDKSAEKPTWHEPGIRRGGIVKWFDPKKGYGFIVPMSSGPDVFVHISEVERVKWKKLDQGQKVEFEIRVNSKGKVAAVKLKEYIE